MDDLIEYFRLDTNFSTYFTEHSVYQQGRRVQERWVRNKELGRGAFGKVWLEVEGNKGKTRAVKQIQKGSNIDYVKELGAIAKFSKYQEHFAQCHGWYESNESIYLAMEFFEHGDLSNCLSGPIPEDNAKDIAKQVAQGLEIMHASGFAHRDLKPQNIFVVVKGPPVWRVKIGDFGISKRVQKDDTAFRTRVGTEGYLAPEMFHYIDDDDEDTDVYTNAVDMWALGSVLYEVLCQEKPFRDLKSLKRFCDGKSSFPSKALKAKRISESGIQCIESLMSLKPTDRSTAKTLLRSSWLRQGIGREALTNPRTPERPIKPNSTGTHVMEEKMHSTQPYQRTKGLQSGTAEEVNVQRVIMRPNEFSAPNAARPESAPAQVPRTTRHDFEPSGSVDNDSGPDEYQSIEEEVFPEAQKNELWSTKTGEEVAKVTYCQVMPSAGNPQLVAPASTQSHRLPDAERYVHNAHGFSREESNILTQIRANGPDKRTEFDVVNDIAEGRLLEIEKEEDRKKTAEADDAKKNADETRSKDQKDTHQEKTHVEPTSVAAAGVAEQSKDNRSHAAARRAAQFDVVLPSITGKHRSNATSGVEPVAEYAVARDTRAHTSPRIAVDPRTVDEILHSYTQKLLLKAGSDVNGAAFAPHGELYWAAREGLRSVVQLLLDKGADVNEQTTNGRKALHCAAEKGHQAVVQLLIEKDADVNAQDQRGITALHYAAKNGNDAIVRLLLKKGAEATTQDNRGNPVLQLTRRSMPRTKGLRSIFGRLAGR
ncbi:hypothetical protein B0A49_05344 [Cryomyces minteri]|uniref:non-specific serine/threonine protein kinase n=1 Tax=Cryomyces minteri TaxID=331657 RepID=A0A4U0X044_9PEZI|nr:hypothetical protein B0A49_05344 [Cryomyces minteri]